jgi:hypothetical protein
MYRDCKARPHRQSWKRVPYEKSERQTSSWVLQGYVFRRPFNDFGNSTGNFHWYKEISAIRYKIRPGDTVMGLAKFFRVTPSVNSKSTDVWTELDKYEQWPSCKQEYGSPRFGQVQFDGAPEVPKPNTVEECSHRFAKIQRPVEQCKAQTW